MQTLTMLVFKLLNDSISYFTLQLYLIYNLKTSLIEVAHKHLQGPSLKYSQKSPSEATWAESPVYFCNPVNGELLDHWFSQVSGGEGDRPL